MRSALQLMPPMPEGSACMAWIQWLTIDGVTERWTEQHPTPAAAQAWIDRRHEEIFAEGGLVTASRVADQEVLVAAPSSFALVVHMADKIADRARALGATGYRGEANAIADLLPSFVRVLRDVGIDVPGLLTVHGGA